MSIITKPGANPVAPNSKTTIAEDTAGIPVVKTTVPGVGSAAPNSKTTIAESTPGIPNNKDTVAESTAGIPTVKTTVAAVSAGIPNSKTTIGLAGIPRSIYPLVSMDFSAGCFSQCNNPVLFDDLFTYSRNSSATFINRRIVCGKAEYFLDTDFVGDVENLLTFTEQFDNSDWSKVNSSINVNKIRSPLGDFTADEFVASSTGSIAPVVQHSVSATDATTHTVSVYVKVSTERFFQIHFVTGRVAGDPRVNFDIKLGLIGSKDLGIIASITPDIDDWLFVTATFVSDSPSIAPSFCLIKSLTDTRNQANSWTAGDGVFLWGAQGTESAKNLPYVKTISSPVTETFTESLRIEYNPVTGENLGTSIEESSTNLALKSEEFDDATWTKIRSSITSNETIAPDLTASADKLVEDSSASTTHLTEQAITFTADEHVLSVYAKAAERSQISLAISDGTNTVDNTFDLLSGISLGSESSDPDGVEIKALSNGWFRCCIKFDTSAGAGDVKIRLADGGTVSYSGDGSSGIFIWGAQLEVLPSATSYIRTEGSTVSRAGDNLSLPSAGNFNADEYSVMSKAIFNMSGSNHAVSITDGTNSNRIQLGSSSGTNLVSGRTDGITQFSINAGAIADNTVHATTLTFSTNNARSYSQGVLVGSDTECLPTHDVNTIYIGSRNATEDFLNGHIKEISIYDKILTAQEVSLL